MLIQLLLLLVIGFALLRLGVSIYNLFRPCRVSPHFLGKEPLVSILVPCRNEAHNIGRLLESLRKQDYAHYELLVLDDESSDNTLEVLESWLQQLPSLKILQGKKLPKGWLGKNYACHNLALEAKGDYLLFLDADVQVKPGLIRNTVGFAHFDRMDLVSIFPGQEMMTAGEKLVVPLMHYILLSLLPLAFISRFRFSSLAAANGQFMLFRAASYRKYRPHEVCKSAITEDIEIARYFKREGSKVQTLLGQGFISARMYHSWKEGLQGFSKNLLSGFGNSAVLMVFFLVITGWLPFLLLVAGTGPLLVWLTAILGIRIANSLAAGQKVWQNLLFHPLQMFTLQLIGFNSLLRNWRKQNSWKGRNISEA